MQIDIRKYANIAPLIEHICRNNSLKDEPELVGLIAIATGAPVIACAYYFAAYKGHISENLAAHIEGIIRFYKYTHIVGVDEVLGQKYAE